MPAASGCRTGSVSHLLLLFLAICSSDCAGRMPGARTQSKLPIEIVAENRQTSSHVCTQPQTHAFRSGSESDTNVGAGCSCHPTGSHHLRSTRVPLHPVWPRASCTLPSTDLQSGNRKQAARSVYSAVVNRGLGSGYIPTGDRPWSPVGQGGMLWARISDLRGTATFAHAPVGFFPRRNWGLWLRPVGYGSLIAPFHKMWHRGLV